VKLIKLTGPSGSLPPQLQGDFELNVGAEQNSNTGIGNAYELRHSMRIKKAALAKERSRRLRNPVNGLFQSSFTVSKPPPGGLTNRNEKQLSDMRYLKLANPTKFKKMKQKEQAKQFLLSRWQRLEQTRVQYVISPPP
jgi:hypothetical protein